VRIVNRKLSCDMKARRGATTWIGLVAVFGAAALVAWFGIAGMSWLTSPGDILAQFRLQAAPRAGFVLMEPVQLLARPRLVLESAAVHAADPAGDEDSSAAAIRSRRLVIDKPVISVDIGVRRGPIEETITDALQPIVARIASLDIQTLAIREGVIRLISSTREIESLTDVDVQIIPQRRTSATISGQATFRGQRLKLNATMSKASANGAESRWPLQATISGALFEARFDGAMGEEKGLRLTGSLDFIAPRLREVARWIGVSLPQAGNLEGLRLRGALDWTGGTMAFSTATLTLDGNEGVGAITIARGGERTAVEGTLAFKRLDLTPYVNSTMVERTLLAPIFTVTQPPVITSLLDSLDADLRISSDALVIPGIEAGQGAIAVTLKNGKLLADVAELAIEDGVFKGQFSVERNGSEPRYGLTGKLDGVEAGRLLQKSLGRNPLQGKADVTLSLTTVGDTREDLLMALDGRAKVVMRESARLGLDLKTLVQLARKSELRGWQAAGTAIMGLDALTVMVDIHKGVLHASIAQAKSGTSAIFGGGYLDLPGRTMEFSLGLRTAETSSRLAAASDVLLLSGPWQSPVVTLERSDEIVHRPPPVLAPPRPIDRK
jgi:hypothetical protein